MRRLKVLFLAGWYPSAERPVNGIFIREHAKAVRLYDDVTVVCTAGKPTGERGLWGVVPEIDPALSEGIPTYRVWQRPIPVRGVGYLLQQWSVVRACEKIMREGFRPDIIHAHIYGAAVPAVRLGRRHRIPVLVTEHWTAYHGRQMGFLAARRAKFAFEHATVVLPVCDALRQAIESYGIRARFRIVPNAVDTELFHPRGASNAGGQAKRMLFVGLMDPTHVKGVPTLLDALSRLGPRLGDWHIDLVGGGPTQEEYERRTGELGLAEKVRFHGRLPKPRIAQLMRESDFLVLPSRVENLPCVISEAMACGLPVLATSVGGVPEMVDATTGLLVPPDDAVALARAIETMLDTASGFDRASIAEKAQRYSYGAVGRLIHGIYEECL